MKTTMIAGILLACTTILTNINAAESVHGDVNGDGKLTASDMEAGRAYIINPTPLRQEEIALWDMNDDGKFSTIDLQFMRIFIRGGQGVGGGERKSVVIEEPSKTFLEDLSGFRRPLGEWQIYAAPNRPTSIPRGRPAIFAAMRFFAAEPLAGGSVMFAIESTVNIESVQKEFVLSIGGNIVTSMMTIEDNTYDHIGTVRFDLTGVEMVQGETEVLLIGQTEAVSGSVIFVWSENGETKRKGAGFPKVYSLGTALPNICSVK